MQPKLGSFSIGSGFLIITPVHLERQSNFVQDKQKCHKMYAGIFGRKQYFRNVSVCINTRFHLQLVNVTFTLYFFIYLEGNTGGLSVRCPLNSVVHPDLLLLILS